MTLKTKKAWGDYFKFNATTIIAALALAWMIAYQGGGAVAKRASAFMDKVETINKNQQQLRVELSAYKIDQRVLYKGLHDTVQMLCMQNKKKHQTQSQ